MINSKFYKIPVEEFEEYINTESSKEKAEILDYLTNYSHLHSLNELKEIEFILYHACNNFSIDLIKIYLNEKIENDSTEMIFKIDKTNQSASLFQIHSNIDEIVIPRTFKYESTEYLITSISSCKAKTLKFVEDSAVTTIYANSFHLSNIQEIYFPKSLIDLKKGWYKKIYRLTKIIVSPSNDKFIFKDDKILLGKTDYNNDDFDIILFARRDIKEITIPSNIKIISSGAFDLCSCLKKVEIQENSNLHTIESKAFAHSSINEFYFPRYLNHLGKGWFKDMPYLSKIIVSPLNDNFIFKDDKFLLGKTNKNNDDFDVLLFVNRDIEEIIIPSNIKIISSYAFQFSKIKQIIIPTQVTKICEYAFSNCKNLTKIEIPPESNLQTIEEYAFFRSNINYFHIPPKVTIICDGVFDDCTNLTKAEIPINCQIIGPGAFAHSNIKEIFIPPNVSEIGNSAFFYCEDLVKVNIPENSKLQIINTEVFAKSSIKDIYIPSNVLKICDHSFKWCKDLQIIEISEESKLETFPLSVFSWSKNIAIMIPSALKKLIIRVD